MGEEKRPPQLVVLHVLLVWEWGVGMGKQKEGTDIIQQKWNCLRKTVVC